MTSSGQARALITGGTAGIGWAFARRIGETGRDVVLVARDQVRLDGRARSLRVRYGVEVETLVADLATEQGRDAVAHRLRDDEAPVDLLVNSAGFGLPGHFSGTDLSDQERMLDVLCRTVLVTCHAAIPGMQRRGRGGIINVSSVAAFGAMGTYSAAKAWVNVFTESLAAELKGTGVHAMAVCPGLTRTEFHDRAQMDMDWLPDVGWLSAEEVADEALADLRRGKVISIPSVRYRAASTLLRHAPAGLTRWGSHRIIRRR